MQVRILNGHDDAGLLRTLYDTVLAPSFPEAEREPVESLARVLDNDELRGAVALGPEGEPLGALCLEWFADVRAALLCYFAVRQDLRGSGIGRALVAGAVPRWRAELRPRVILAEAEDPHFHAVTPEFGDGEARLRLYSSYGARRLPIDYLVPELTPGAGRLKNLLLLVAEADPGALVGDGRISGELIERFLVRYYTRAEGRAPAPGDDELHALLAQCRADRGLPLLDLTSPRGTI